MLLELAEPAQLGDQPVGQEHVASTAALGNLAAQADSDAGFPESADSVRSRVRKISVGFPIQLGRHYGQNGNLNGPPNGGGNPNGRVSSLSSSKRRLSSWSSFR